MSKFIYSDIILPAAKIPDGSISAALSVPLQQTSRYLKYFEDEVTQEEKAAIDAVASYHTLSTVYWADRSDYAKQAWRKEATDDDIAGYFKVWADMLKKHPLTYVAATANNCYAYFYPVVTQLDEFEKASIAGMESCNSSGYFKFEAADGIMAETLKALFYIGDTMLMRMPIVNILCTSALYVWILIFAWSQSIVKRDKKLLMIVIPMLFLMLTILTGPCNGNIYVRFTYPVAMCVPVIAGYGIREKGDEADDRGM